MKNMLRNQIIKASWEIDSIKDLETRAKLRVELISSLEEYVCMKGDISIDPEELPTEISEEDEVKNTDEEIKNVVPTTEAFDETIEESGVPEEVQEINEEPTRIVIENEDCTDIFNSLGDSLTIEEKTEIAYELKTKEEFKEYWDLLNKIEDSSYKVEMVKILLDYEFESINEVFKSFTNGELSFEEGLNDNNISAFLTYINKLL